MSRPTPAVPQWLLPWFDAERGATQLRYFEPNLIPGLLQTEAGSWVGHLENQLGGIVVDSEDGLDTLQARWENVRNEALPRRQSIDLMKEVQSEHGPQ